MNTSFVPNWEPIERLHEQNKVDIDDFMFMGTYLIGSVAINAYKNRDTRLYLNLSNDGTAWKYEVSSYIPIDINLAISLAYGKTDQPN